MGRQDRANHQYDLSDFWAAADTGRLPAVSCLKATRNPGSSDPLNALTSSGMCGTQTAKVPTSHNGIPEQAGCGLGRRLPLLVLSPHTRRDLVDSTLTDHSPILRLIEDNWRLPRLGNGSTDASAGTLDGMFSASTAAGRIRPCSSIQRPGSQASSDRVADDSRIEGVA